MVSVQAEYKYWDPARVGTDTTRRVPDVVCTHPHTHVEYVLDARIFWNSMSAGPGGYISYDHTGWGAEQGERQKQESWDEAIGRMCHMIDRFIGNSNTCLDACPACMYWYLGTRGLVAREFQCKNSMD